MSSFICQDPESVCAWAHCPFHSGLQSLVLLWSGCFGGPYSTFTTSLWIRSFLCSFLFFWSFLMSCFFFFLSKIVHYHHKLRITQILTGTLYCLEITPCRPFHLWLPFGLIISSSVLNSLHPRTFFNLTSWLNSLCFRSFLGLPPFPPPPRPFIFVEI